MDQDLTLALTDCPLLERIDFAHNELGYVQTRNPLLAKVTVARLPHLRSIHVASSHFSRDLDISDAMASILTQGFPLRHLWLGDQHIHPSVVRLLTLPSCAGLETLWICPFPERTWTTIAEAGAALLPCMEDCGETLEALPALTNLSLRIPEGNSQLHKLKWVLPALRSLELCDRPTFRSMFSSYIDSCPFFDCALLESFTAETVSPMPAVFEHIVSMLEPCKRLRHMRIEQQREDDTFQCVRLISALTSQSWLRFR